MFDFTRNSRLKSDKLLAVNSLAVAETDFEEGIFTPQKTNFNTKLNKVIIVLFLVFGFSISQAFGQRDQITTQAGEKIRCRILDETPSRFVYAYLSPTGKVLRNEIFKNLVSDFKYNFYPSDIVTTKGNKLPDGLGGAREENVAATQRVDTRKSEPTKTKSESKKNDKNNKAAETEEKTVAKESSSKKDAEKVEKNTETTQKDEKPKVVTTKDKKVTPKKKKRSPRRKML